MSTPIIRKLLEKRLLTISEDFPTGFENDKFKPKKGEAHQFVTLMKNPTRNPTQGPHFQREMGRMQVALYFPAAEGAGPSEARAKEVKDLFRRGTTMTEGTLRVLIDESPYEVPGPTKDGWYQLLVYVPYIGDVYQ